MKWPLSSLLIIPVFLCSNPMAHAIPGGNPLINLPSISTPAFVDTFEGQPEGGVPLGWVVPFGSASISPTENHTLGGLQSVALSAGGGGAAQMRRPVPAGTKGFTVAIDPKSIPFGTTAELMIQYTADTFQYTSRYNFVDGFHYVDAGLGLEYDSTVGPENFSDWNVFDYDVTPLFSPALGIMVCTDCDHSPQITFWSNGRCSPAATQATSISEIAITLINLTPGPLSVSVDDLRTYNEQIIAIGTFSADFNHDGVVNGLDLKKWSDDFSHGGGSDADGDGDSDGADFLLWQQQLVGNFDAAAIPEPTTLVLACFFIGAVMASNGSKRRCR